MKRLMILIAVLFLSGFQLSGQALSASTDNKCHSMISHDSKMPMPAASKEAGKKSTAKEDIKCPVTGNKVDPAKAYAKTTYKGKTYYFCCAGCPEEFTKNPGKYAK